MNEVINRFLEGGGKGLLGLLALWLGLQFALGVAQAEITVAPSSQPPTQAVTPVSRAPLTAKPATTPPILSPSPGPSPTPGPKLVKKPPAVAAASALLVDADTGRILYSKNARTQRPMASTTKLMTALTFLSIYPDRTALQARTTVVEDDLVGEASMGLRLGEQISLNALLLGLLTNSANEAGMSLARYAGARMSGPAEPVERFVAAMNAYALSLGMYDTHFMNPHGLDQPGHYSTAYDLAISGMFALRQPLLLADMQFMSGTVEGHQIFNVNNFLRRYPGATGLKPGLTDDAGPCLVATARNNGHNVLAVVLNSPRMIADVDGLMDYGFTLLAGQAETPLSALNLGSLNLPKVGVRRVKAADSPKALEAALRLQLDYTLRLLANLDF